METPDTMKMKTPARVQSPERATVLLYQLNRQETSTLTGEMLSESTPEVNGVRPWRSRKMPETPVSMLLPFPGGSGVAAHPRRGSPPQHAQSARGAAPHRCRPSPTPLAAGR